MKEFIRKKKHWIISISWLALLLVFTYTPLIHAMLKGGEVFKNVYFESQSSWSAMFVNGGLLLMLIVDYWGAQKQPTIVIWGLSIFAILLAMIIFAHTGAYAAGELSEYQYLLNDYRFSYSLHIAFLGILLYIKIRSMVKDSDDNSLIIEEEY